MSTAAGNFFVSFVKQDQDNLIRFPLFKDGSLVSGITFSGSAVQISGSYYSFCDWDDLIAIYPAEVGSTGIYEAWLTAEAIAATYFVTLLIPATANYDDLVIQFLVYGDTNARLNTWYDDTVPVLTKKNQEFKIARGK